MRTIKFRVWSNKQKTYDYKHPFNEIGNFYISQNGVLFSDYGNAVTPEVNVKAFVVEQFTGLYDKNCKPIYEGDILELNGLRAEVVFDKGIFCVILDGARWVVEDRYEIVGNIHENKELLNGIKGTK